MPCRKEKPIEVKVTFSPAPDARERLRRVAALLLRPRPDDERQKDGMAEDDGQTTQP